MISDFFLKFDSKLHCENILSQAGLVLDDVILTDSETHSLYIIGEIWKPTGVFSKITDLEGNILQIEERGKLDGYHANLRLIDIELPEILQPFTIVPQNPMYGWL